MLKYFFISFLLILTACDTADNKDIIGKWKMKQVMQDGQDVSLQHNPLQDRHAIFHADSSFESFSKLHGNNSGRYSYDPNTCKLFIDSDTGPEDDSQWIVEIKGDTMIWQGFGTEWADRFQLIHIREK